MIIMMMKIMLILNVDDKDDNNDNDLGLEQGSPTVSYTLPCW